MAVKASAQISLNFKTEKQVEILLDALKPEANSLINRRAKINLIKQNACLIVSAEAEDTIALRALINAYLRWINSTVDALEFIEQS
jgi:tRNA threonylcarbamoyladenosine modification (KEOPS) complex  Pcc1 subunit